MVAPDVEIDDGKGDCYLFVYLLTISPQCVSFLRLFRFTAAVWELIKSRIILYFKLSSLHTLCLLPLPLMFFTWMSDHEIW